MGKSENSISNKFDDEELLFRAVSNKNPIFWINGRVSSAALKDKNGLSVYRLYDRTKDQTIFSMKDNNLHGAVVSLKVSDCKDVSAVVKYLPSKENDYHSEIHGSETIVLLNDFQAHKLAQKAVIVCRSLATFSYN